VLEVGVGAGTDFVNWVRADAQACGVDLTPAGVALTRERLALEGLQADVRVADAEALPFPDGMFDIVYSWACYITRRIPQRRFERCTVC